MAREMLRRAREVNAPLLHRTQMLGVAPEGG
jgi:hypothetical protein